MDEWIENLNVMFSPKSVAVVGASRREGSIGRAILKNLVDYQYQGIVYPVNPKTDSVYAIRSYPDLKAIPGPVELVMVVVPSHLVKMVIQESIEIGAKAAVIITAGFREVSEEGAAEEREIAQMATVADLRLIGPNCMGIIHGHYPNLNATFAPRQPL
ncbi:MAG: CoA-binding protein, partial [Candidatus Kariarchaeaceae archaeon]